MSTEQDGWDEVVDTIVGNYREEIGDGPSPPMRLLISDLQDVRENHPFPKKVDRLIQQAQNNEFDDFLSPFACPQVILEKLLREAGLNDLAKNVREAKYDT